MAQILHGAPVREGIKNRLIERIKKLKKKPVLAIVQVGDRADSNTYIKNKIKFGEEIGVGVKYLKIERLKEGKIKGEELIEEIEKLNRDENIDGIIIQLPLPDNLNSEKILECIDKNKDADGLRGTEESEIVVTPATARAVMSLLDFYKIEVKNKKVAVIGRSKLAGGSIAEVLKKRGADVEVCHKGTENTAEVCGKADILVSAAGQAGLVAKEFVNQDQVVIDVGINRNQDGKLVGDVDFEEVEPIVRAISPVPGGVGLITVACLFENLLDLVDKGS